MLLWIFLLIEGISTLREVDCFKASDVSISNGQVRAPTRGLNSNLTFSSRPPSCLKWMPQIAENGNKSLEENSDQNRHIVNGNGSSKSHMPSFTGEFWDNSAFNSTKTESEDEIMFSTSNGLESQVYIKVGKFTCKLWSTDTYTDTWYDTDT